MSIGDSRSTLQRLQCRTLRLALQEKAVAVGGLISLMCEERMRTKYLKHIAGFFDNTFNLYLVQTGQGKTVFSYIRGTGAAGVFFYTGLLPFHPAVPISAGRSGRIGLWLAFPWLLPNG